MIGAVDIGNTRTKFALFREDGALVAEKAWLTGQPFAKEAGALFDGMLDRAVVGSVVPLQTPIWAEFLMSRANLLHVAGHDSPWGFRVEVESPETLGIDRLANLEGALSFAGSVLVVDAGTATKFDLLEGVGARRSFPGGAIAPGLSVSYEAMLARAAQLMPLARSPDGALPMPLARSPDGALPMPLARSPDGALPGAIELNKHSPVVGYNTETAIRSGVLHGFAAQVDGMVARIFEERGVPAPFTVVATGGNSSYLNSRARLITHQRPRLTLEGLRDLARKV